MIIIDVWPNPIQTRLLLFYVFRALEWSLAALGKDKKNRKNKAAREADFNRILFDIAMYMIDSNVHDNT